MEVKLKYKLKSQVFIVTRSLIKFGTVAGIELNVTEDEEGYEVRYKVLAGVNMYKNIPERNIMNDEEIAEYVLTMPIQDNIYIDPRVGMAVNKYRYKRQQKKMNPKTKFTTGESVNILLDMSLQKGVVKNIHETVAGEEESILKYDISSNGILYKGIPETKILKEHTGVTFSVKETFEVGVNLISYVILNKITTVIIRINGEEVDRIPLSDNTLNTIMETVDAYLLKGYEPALQVVNVDKSYNNVVRMKK